MRIITGNKFISRILLLALSLVAFSVSAEDVIWIKSDDGSIVANGGEVIFTTPDTVIQLEKNLQNGIDVLFTPPEQNHPYKIQFSAPDSQGLQVGTYTQVQRFGLQAPGRPGVDYTGPSQYACDPSGEFALRELAYLTDGSISSLAIDLILLCGNSLRESHIYIRINSNIPVGPVGPIADAGKDQTVSPGTSVSLDGTKSRATDDRAFSYAWTQQTGTPVNLVTTDQAILHFAAPAIHTEYEILEFRLTILDDLGRQSSDEVSVIVSNNLSPASFFVYKRKFDDWLGRVETQRVDGTDVQWSVQRDDNNGIKIQFDCSGIAPICNSSGLNLNLWSINNSEPRVGSSESGN